MSRTVYLNLPKPYKGHYYTLVFDSAADCAFFLGVSRNMVTLVCKGKKKSVKTLQPSYFDHPLEFRLHDEYPRTHLLYSHVLREYDLGIFTKKEITWDENYAFIASFSHAYPGYF